RLRGTHTADLLYDRLELRILGDATLAVNAREFRLFRDFAFLAQAGARPAAGVLETKDGAAPPQRGEGEQEEGGRGASRGRRQAGRRRASRRAWRRDRAATGRCGGWAPCR